MSATMLNKLTALKGSCSPFSTEVKKLKRPYIALTEAEFNTLVQGPSDYYQLPDGRVVTFGAADGGYALMPLNNKEAGKILNKNGVVA